MKTNKNVGVYQILNKQSGKCYIGSTLSLKTRKENHFNSLRRGSHCNKALQSDFNKFGESSFEFSVLENCQANKCYLRERYYVKLLQPNKYGYNKARIVSKNKIVPSDLHSRSSRTFNLRTSISENGNNKIHSIIGSLMNDLNRKVTKEEALNFILETYKY